MASKPTPQTRRACFLRDRVCVRCGRAVGRFSLHHRRMRSHPFDGLHEPSNLILLCGSGTTGCHGWVHAHPKEAMRDGWLVSAYRDPARVPVTYRDGKYYLDEEGNRLETL